MIQKEVNKSGVTDTINGRSLVQQWLYSLTGVPESVKRQVFSDAMFHLSTKGITNLDSLTKEQVSTLRNVLGTYGIRAIAYKKYYPQSVQPTAVQPVAAQPVAAQPVAAQPTAVQPTAVQPTAVQPVAVQPTAVQPTAVQPTAVQPTAVQPTATGRQNLTFNDLLNDLGLTGKESADPTALKKVQDWLAARPGYKPGAKTNAYLEQLKSMPAETKKKSSDVSKKKAPTKGYKFNNKGLYKDAMHAYKAGGATFVGNDGNAEFFNRYDVSKFTVSDANQKEVINPNIILALKQRF